MSGVEGGRLPDSDKDRLYPSGRHLPSPLKQNMLWFHLQSHLHCVKVQFHPSNVCYAKCIKYIGNWRSPDKGTSFCSHPTFTTIEEQHISRSDSQFTTSAPFKLPVITTCSFKTLQIAPALNKRNWIQTSTRIYNLASFSLFLTRYRPIITQGWFRRFRMCEYRMRSHLYAQYSLWF